MIIGRLLVPTNLWVPRTDRVFFVAQYGRLFEGCRGRCHWWLLVDATATLVVAILSSVHPDSEVGCRSVAWALLAFVVCVLLGFGAVQPTNTIAKTVGALILFSAQPVVVLCAIAGANDAASAVSLAASITSICLSVLPMIYWFVVSRRGAVTVPNNSARRRRRRCDPTGLSTPTISLLVPPVFQQQQQQHQQQQSSCTTSALQMLVEAICNDVHERPEHLALRLRPPDRPPLS
jgi:Na+/melibiose symporter-like transporter